VLSPVSHTFHGRDVFAPGAAHLAVGTPLEQTGAAIPLDDLIRLELAGPMVTGHRVGTRVTGIDGFGNVQLDATGDHLRAAGIRDSVSLGGEVVPIVRIFADLPERGVGLIVDSQGFVAIVVNRGSAAEALQLTQGSSVVLEAPQDPGGDDHGERHLQPVD
jgi:S-adenosylmethionine hydrolase